MGLDEAAQAVRRSEKGTQCGPKLCFPKSFSSFIPDSACETIVQNVLAPQPFQDSVTTAPPTTLSVKAQKSHEGRKVQGKGETLYLLLL